MWGRSELLISGNYFLRHYKSTVEVKLLERTVPVEIRTPPFPVENFLHFDSSQTSHSTPKEFLVFPKEDHPSVLEWTQNPFQEEGYSSKIPQPQEEWKEEEVATSERRNEYTRPFRPNRGFPTER